MLQLSSEDMLYLVNKWVSDAALTGNIHSVSRGYYNGEYISFTKSPSFYNRIQFMKDDLDIYIDYDADDDSDLFKITVLNDIVGQQLCWYYPTLFMKLKEFYNMLKVPTVDFIKYLESPTLLADS